MSWAGFKKNVNRATTQVMMKTGHVERTSDRDYEVEERYGTQDSTALSLTDSGADDTERWKRQRTDFRRKRKGTWTVSEVCVTLRLHKTRPNIQAAMTASQMRIAETIDAFYGDAGTRDGVSRSYKQAVEDLDAETIKALDGPFR